MGLHPEEPAQGRGGGTEGMFRGSRAALYDVLCSVSNVHRLNDTA